MIFIVDEAHAVGSLPVLTNPWNMIPPHHNTKSGNTSFLVSTLLFINPWRGVVDSAGFFLPMKRGWEQQVRATGAWPD